MPRTFWAALRDQGHEVRLIPAQYVKPYVQTNKSGYIDAEAIAEAVQRPRMRFVPIKTEEQLDLQALHRVRERWVMRRTAVVNQIRSLLLERGLTLRLRPLRESHLSAGGNDLPQVAHTFAAVVLCHVLDGVYPLRYLCKTDSARNRCYLQNRLADVQTDSFVTQR